MLSVNSGAENGQRANYRGEPALINGKQVMGVGCRLRQLDQMLRANGLMTELKVVDDIKPLEEIRADLKSALEGATG